MPHDAADAALQKADDVLKSVRTIEDTLDFHGKWMHRQFKKERKIIIATGCGLGAAIIAIGAGALFGPTLIGEYRQSAHTGCMIKQFEANGAVVLGRLSAWDSYMERGFSRVEGSLPDGSFVSMTFDKGRLTGQPERVMQKMVPAVSAACGL